MVNLKMDVNVIGWSGWADSDYLTSDLDGTYEWTNELWPASLAMTASNVGYVNFTVKWVGGVVMTIWYEGDRAWLVGLQQWLRLRDLVADLCEKGRYVILNFWKRSLKTAHCETAGLNLWWWDNFDEKKIYEAWNTYGDECDVMSFVPWNHQ